MARFKDHEKALILRQQGKSYSQIKTILAVSKSTLSYWLREYPLSKERIRELRDWNEQRIEKYRETMRIKKEVRLRAVYIDQRRILLPLTRRELFIAGLFLYWGEGSKSRESDISVSNTDPTVIKFFVRWLTDIWGISKKELRVQLQLYSDMNLDREINYWAASLKLLKSQFNKPYVKRTSQYRINHKGAFGHGTCNVKYGSARLKEKILMSIKALADEYSGQ